MWGSRAPVRPRLQVGPRPTCLHFGRTGRGADDRASHQDQTTPFTRGSSMNSELLRIIEAIHLEKDIPKELIFQTIESAMVAAIQKAVEPKLGKDVPIRCTLDRSTGQLSVTSDVDTGAIDLGRIAAQTAKQVIIQSLREAENQAVYAEYHDKVGQLVLGTVQR